MRGVLTAVCLLSAVFSAQAFLESIFGGGGNAEWDGLKVGFGINPFSKTTFDTLPRTVADALNDGWVLDKAAGNCGADGSYFRGNRYLLNGDKAAMLLFDKSGYVAGIQAGIPKTAPPATANYPKPNNAKYHVFNEESDAWVITTYFVDPATICTAGRTEEEFKKYGTGDALRIQNSTTPDSYITVPRDEAEVTKKTKFILGQCFYGMGNHYWYDIRDTMDCDDTFPVFLLYNKKRLNAFGWAFNPNYDSSYRWEHPSQSAFKYFLPLPFPPCLGKDEPTSTLHIYLSTNPIANLC